MRRDYSVRLALSIAIILLIVPPWTSFVGHIEGHSIRWVPFAPPILKRDIAANILLYMPFGYLYVRRLAATNIWNATLWALLLSVGTETLQLFSHGRFTSATDVACNTLGAAAGALAGLWRRTRT